MSNFLAIATVTAGLVQILQAAIGADVPGATVTTVRPDAAGNGTPNIGANLYLFQVTPNAAWRNADLPTRNANGQLMQRPRVALDLHFLLTFYGDENQLEPQRVLGSVVRTLHERPVLTREVIRNATVANPFLAASNLADEVELLKFTPIALSLEELSKLWSVFFQIPYTLSVAYQGTVVFIESEVTPRTVLPVRERNIYVLPFRHPVIGEVASQAGSNQPIVAGSTLVVRGRQLRGDDTLLRIGPREVTPEDVTDTQISVRLAEPPLPADSLRAGVQGVQVVHRLLIGTPPVPHRGFASNVAPFVLRPTITDVRPANVQGAEDDPRSADVTVTVDPKIRQRQRVVLLLNEIAAEGARAYTFEPPPTFKLTAPDLENLRSEGVPDNVVANLETIKDQEFIGREVFLSTLKRTIGEEQTATFQLVILKHASLHADRPSVTFRISNVKAAEYLVRVQVEGAESLLKVDEDRDSPTFNRYIGPKVTIA